MKFARFLIHISDPYYVFSPLVNLRVSNTYPLSNIVFQWMRSGSSKSVPAALIKTVIKSGHTLRWLNSRGSGKSARAFAY